MEHPRKVLIITYYWPPAGGPGVQRLLKFAKYLPQSGWKPVILTVEDGNYPAIDESLIKEIPPEIEVIHCRHFEPDQLYKRFVSKDKSAIPVAVLADKKLSWKAKIAHWIRLNLFIPDAKLFWVKKALKAEEEILNGDYELIFSSSPPPTVHLIAMKLKEKYNVKWVADFRDPWTKIHYYRDSERTNWAKRKDEKLEKEVVSQCDGITTASRLFQELLPIDKNKPCKTITNGFDDEVFRIEAAKLAGFTLVHMGGITTNRYYQEFFEGVRKCLINEEFKDNFKLILIGKVNSDIIEKIKKYVPPENLNITGYLDHDKALSMMKAASVCLIFLEKMQNYKGHIPGKVFEYIAVQRPVIGAGDPLGDAAKIIRKSKCGDVFPADYKWQNIILDAYENWKQGNLPKVDMDYINGFHRSNLTRKLADFFEEI